MVNNKKAQMKIQQTAFVLIAVTLFFVLVGMFFLNFKMEEMKEAASAQEEEDAITLVSKLANSPEFSCGSSFKGEMKGSCVDFDKVMALKKEIEKNERWKELWGVEGIELRKIYPINESEDVECTEETYPNCNRITLIESERTGKENYVSLCRKNDLGYRAKSECYLGKLIVNYKKVE